MEATQRATRALGGMGAIRTTWIDLVSAVSDAAAGDAETVAVVRDWLASGFVRRASPALARTPAARRPFAAGRRPY